jgi:hypothetical protein
VVLDEITEYLSFNGVGSMGVDLFYGAMKESYPSSVIIVQIYGGIQDEPSLGDSTSFGRAIRLEYPRIQILCRGVRDDTTGPYQRAVNARDALVRISNQVLKGVKYLAVEPLQPPFRLRSDENFREHYAFNCQVTKEIVAGIDYGWIDPGL